MRAYEAKEISKQAFSNGLNFQRNYVLDRIRISACIGKTYVVLNEDHIVLFEDDYMYFEKLGYEVIREIRTPGYIKFGLIRWSE